MKLWTTIWILYWISGVGACGATAFYVYRAAYANAVVSAAQIKEFRSGCEVHCMQSGEVNVLTDVIPITLLGMMAAAAAVIGFYLYLRPSLQVVAELSKQE